MIKSPIVSSPQLEDIRHLSGNDFKPVTVPALFHTDQANGLKTALDKLCERAEDLVQKGIISLL